MAVSLARRARNRANRALRDYEPVEGQIAIALEQYSSFHPDNWYFLARYSPNASDITLAPGLSVPRVLPILVERDIPEERSWLHPFTKPNPTSWFIAARLFLGWDFSPNGCPSYDSKKKWTMWVFGAENRDPLLDALRFPAEMYSTGIVHRIITSSERPVERPESSKRKVFLPKYRDSNA